LVLWDVSRNVKTSFKHRPSSIFIGNDSSVSEEHEQISINTFNLKSKSKV